MYGVACFYLLPAFFLARCVSFLSFIPFMHFLFSIFFGVLCICICSVNSLLFFSLPFVSLVYRLLSMLFRFVSFVLHQIQLYDNCYFRNGFDCSLVLANQHLYDERAHASTIIHKLRLFLTGCVSVRLYRGAVQYEIHWGMYSHFERFLFT